MDEAKHRKQTLQKLAEYQKANLSDFEQAAMSISNESDRGAVVILGSLTEDLLLQRIMENFVVLPKERDLALLWPQQTPAQCANRGQF